MRRGLAIGLLAVNVALLVASDEHPHGGDTEREDEPVCEALSLDDATFTTDDEGVLLVAVAGVDGAGITRVQGVIEVPCPAVVEIGADVVDVYPLGDGDTGEPLFAFDEALFQAAEELVLTVTACPAAEVGVQIRLVEACDDGPPVVVLEQR